MLRGVYAREVPGSSIEFVNLCLPIEKNEKMTSYILAWKFSKEIRSGGLKPIESVHDGEYKLNARFYLVQAYQSFLDHFIFMNPLQGNCF